MDPDDFFFEVQFRDFSLRKIKIDDRKTWEFHGQMDEDFFMLQKFFQRGDEIKNKKSRFFFEVDTLSKMEYIGK